MIYPPQLTIQLRQRQLQDIYGNPIIFTGATPLTLSQSIGTVSRAWVDYTNFCDGLPKIALTWSTSQTPTGQASEGQFIPKKGVSGTLTFERDAYTFLKAILVDDVAAPLNQVEVQITDESCGTFEGYIIRSSNLSWCEFNSTCTYDLNLKQEDYFTQCIERTMIADNWQGWFQTEPKEIDGITNKYHPRFSYCTEHRPNGTLIIEWYMFSVMGFLSLIIVLLSALVDAVIAILNAIISVINSIISVVNGLSGGSIGTISSISYIPVTSAFDSASQMFIEAAGCGREHPAPLVRDYITNVCDRCGISVNAATADIFFAPIINIQTSDGIARDKPNPHYNACLFFPAVKRGIRRFASINLFGTSAMDTTTFYDTNNQPIWALSDMLDYLKLLYNAQWRIITEGGLPYLYFKRKDWYQNQAPLYDFSVGGADRHKLVEGICYEPTDYTVPASCSGLYKDDPADKCGHEASMPMNGDPLSFNNTMVNPLFHGILDKTTGFGATKFRLDGASNDYIYDAGQVVLNGSFLNPTIGAQMDDVFKFVRQFGDYAVLLQGETVALPKILIWDGLDNNDGLPTAGNPYLNARALRKDIIIAGVTYSLGKTAWPGTVGSISEPDINPLWPSQVPAGAVVLTTLITPSTIPTLLAWHNKYPPQTNVIGHSLSFSPPHVGEYTVQNIAGTEISRNAAILVNYPMYFEPYYMDSMWDWFHWIDDPYHRPRLHKNWRLKIPMCCEDIEKLKITGDGSEAMLLGVVTLDTLFYNDGVITDIEIGYDNTNNGNNNGTGQYLSLKGFV